MKRSTKDHIRTTYTGSLPRPPEMLDTIRAMAGGQHYDTNAYERALTNHVAESVSKQVAAGIDIVADGECSKPSFRSIWLSVSTALNHVCHPEDYRCRPVQWA